MGLSQILAEQTVRHTVIEWVMSFCIFVQLIIPCHCNEGWVDKTPSNQTNDIVTSAAACLADYALDYFYSCPTNCIYDGLCTCPINSYRFNMNYEGYMTACLSCSKVGCPDQQYRVSCGLTYVGTCSNCRICPSGTSYTNCAGNTLIDDGVCSNCIKGSYSESGTWRSCPLCDKGKYNTQDTATSCISCLEGSYNSALGQTTCTKCSAGKYCSSAQCTDCTLCLAGKFWTGTGGTTADVCALSCIPGQFSTITGAGSSSFCIMCFPGTYSLSSGTSTCLSCMKGSYSSATGASSSSSCTLCPYGTYSSASGLTINSACVTCSAGTYSTAPGATLISACIPCSPGKYSTGMQLTADSTCSLCIKGKYSTATGLIADTDCLLCSAGTYSTVSGATDISTCIACSPGTYSILNGAALSSLCIPCTTGKYSTVTGAITSTSCIPCPTDQCLLPGQYSTCGIGTLGSCSQCQNVPSSSTVYYVAPDTAGFNPICPTARSAPGAFRNCSNPQFPMWFFSPPPQYGTSCTHQGTVNGQPYYLCKSSGMYMWWQDSQWVGSTDINNLGTTTFAFNGPSRISGSVLDPIAILYPAISSLLWESFCLVGSYSSISDSSACTVASPGNYVPTSGASAQIACASGVFSFVGASTCSANCPAGTYNAASGSQCLVTVAGTYSTAGKATPCPQGTYTSITGATTCTGCIAGTYSTATGSVSTAACALCSPGTYTSSSNGSPNCTLCGAGFYNPNSGVTVCTVCLTGKYSNVPGASACISCTNGNNFTNVTGATTCTACSTTCPIGKQIQLQCSPSNNIICNLCTPIPNCYFVPNTACGNSTNPNCLCPPGYELTGGVCQQCRNGFFQRTNSSSLCSPWNTSLTCATGYHFSNGSRFTDTSCIPCPTTPGNTTLKGPGCQWACKAGFNATVIK